MQQYTCKFLRTLGPPVKPRNKLKANRITPDICSVAKFAYCSALVEHQQCSVEYLCKIKDVLNIQKICLILQKRKQGFIFLFSLAIYLCICTFFFFFFLKLLLLRLNYIFKTDIRKQDFRDAFCFSAVLSHGLQTNSQPADLLSGKYCKLTRQQNPRSFYVDIKLIAMPQFPQFLNQPDTFAVTSAPHLSKKTFTRRKTCQQIIFVF